MTAAPTDPLERLLTHVRGRLAWAAFGRTLLWTAAAACGLVAAACTLGWLRPAWLPAILTAALPVAAALAVAAAAVLRRRPDRLDAARTADLHAGTKDLFLTAAELQADQPQAFAPLVRQNAAARAPAWTRSRRSRSRSREAGPCRLGRRRLCWWGCCSSCRGSTRSGPSPRPAPPNVRPKRPAPPRPPPRPAPRN